MAETMAMKIKLAETSADHKMNSGTSTPRDSSERRQSIESDSGTRTPRERVPFGENRFSDGDVTPEWYASRSLPGVPHAEELQEKLLQLGDIIQPGEAIPDQGESSSHDSVLPLRLANIDDLAGKSRPSKESIKSVTLSAHSTGWGVRQEITPQFDLSEIEACTPRSQDSLGNMSSGWGRQEQAPFYSISQLGSSSDSDVSEEVSPSATEDYQALLEQPAKSFHLLHVDAGWGMRQEVPAQYDLELLESDDLLLDAEGVLFPDSLSSMNDAPVVPISVRKASTVKKVPDAPRLAEARQVSESKVMYADQDVGLELLCSPLPRHLQLMTV
eukprot:gb/GFBE01049849.1/.p1 GENE.gb/GFBE01049849.1/~~gb/GFBE01049849.1/.p1  ORF type:complete len:329 (+),score=64.74 gb/GFBE01049849.1/:1-987(+)